MTTLRMVLAGGFMKNLPLYAGIAVGAILLIAFIVGVVKGVRNLSWGAFYWSLASVGFVFAYQFLGEMNLLEKLLPDALAGLAESAWIIALALACILISLLFYGIFSAILRPREVWVRDNDNCYDGWHYDVDYDDDTTFKGGLGQELTVRKYKSGIFGRFFGGLLCVFNVLFVVAIIAVIGMVIIQATGLKDMNFASFLTKGFMSKVTDYVLGYGLDVLMLGLVFLIAYKGFKAGLIGSARTLIKTLGMLAVIGFAFAAPFIKTFAGLPVLSDVIEGCINMWDKAFPVASSILGKITAGLIFAIVGGVVVAVLGFILGKVTDKIADTTVVRAVDGTLAALVFLVIGLVVVLLIWEALYLLDHFNVLQISQAFNEKAGFSSALFTVAGEIFDFLAPMVQGLFDKLPF